MGFFSFRKKKKGLLEPEVSPPKRMGLLDSDSLESEFDRRVPIIFPTRSPINSLAGPPEETKHAEEITPKYSGRFMKKLLESKRDLDEVYSKGYFENHYPEADKQLKEFLHGKTMTSWAKTMKEEPSYEEHNDKEEHPSGGITIVLNVNK